jgi:uncharacterized damage-inducible protein DinB
VTDEPAAGARVGSLLDEAVESWVYAREGVLEEAEVIADDEYDFRPAPESRSVAELLRHIVESGLMMAGELSDPEGDFTRDDFPGFMERYAGHLPESPGPAELREILRSSLEDGTRKLRHAGEDAILRPIRRFDGEWWTRLAWMNHGIAHEEYHRGQLALYARLLGHVPALTQKILSAETEGDGGD